MDGVIEKIFIALEGGAEMQVVEAVEALAGSGLRGDRYCHRSGHWAKKDESQVTLIEKESLEAMARQLGVEFTKGEHRRNLVTRGLRLESLEGKLFRVGGAVLEFHRQRPTCHYIESITTKGMTKALVGRSGIGARVVQSGLIRINDPIEVL